MMISFFFWLIACIFSTFGVSYFYYHLVDCKNRINFKIICFYFVGVIVQAVIKYYDLTFWSIVSYFLFYPILFYLLKPDRIKKILYYTVVIWSIGLLFDYLNMLFVSFISTYYHFDVYAYWFKLIPTIIMAFLFYIASHVSFIKKFINRLYVLIDRIKYIDFFLVAFSIFILTVCIFLSFNIQVTNVIFMISIILILSIFVFLLLLKVKYDEIENRIFVETLKENNNFYIEIDNEQRILKHNLIAKLSGVKSVANRKSRLLVDELIREFNSNMDYSAKIRSIPYGLNGVISHKLNDYLDVLNIKIYNNIKFDLFDVLSPKKYNVLVEKLSLLIDNALESCLNSVEKTLIINLFSYDDIIKIEIKNTFNGKVDIESLGNINYSTKGKRRGLGLYSILRNSEVSTNVKIVNDFFVCELVTRMISQTKN